LLALHKNPSCRTTPFYSPLLLVIFVAILLIWVRWDRWYSDGLGVGRPGLDSRQLKEIVLFSNMSRTALGSTQSLTQWVSETVSQG
jgi:hypothetical protein